MREIQRSAGRSGQGALEAQRPQFPHEFDEELKARRHVPAAGIVEMKATPEGGPILEDDSQFTCVQERPDEGLRNIQKTRSSFDGRQSDLRLVDDERARDVDLDLLLPALKLPAVNPLIARTYTDTAMGFQVIGVRWDAKPL